MAGIAFDSRIVGLVRNLSFAQDIQGVMDAVKVVARDLSGADGVTFVLRDGNLCHYAEENAVGPLWKGKRFPMSACISGWVMLNKTAAAIEDIYADPRIPAEAYRPTFVKSLVMVPVRQDDPIAAIGAYWASPRVASREELQQLQAIADSAAVAIANVHLLQDLRNSVARERAAREEAERANRMKDAFLSMVSHELRTPLTPMSGWADMLSQNMPKDRFDSALTVIRRNIEAQKRVVNDLLDFSAISIGKLKIEARPMDWSSAVEGALDSVRPMALARNVNLDVQLKPALVYGDEIRLQQAAWNLLTNAVKFNLPGGHVTVRLSCEQSHAELVVTDMGEGIDPAALPHIFERFFQADPGISRMHGGLGLGLSLVKHIVELHGGTCKAESAGVGKGAQFTITLPCLSV